MRSFEGLWYKLPPAVPMICIQTMVISSHATTISVSKSPFRQLVWKLKILFVFRGGNCELATFFSRAAVAVWRKQPNLS